MLGSKGELTSRYVLKGMVGQGAVGVVHRAFDRDRECDVALKRLHSPHPNQVYRLKREFRGFAQTHHTNLVQLYELTVQDDGTVFYTMELLDGVDPRVYCAKPLSAAAPDAPASDQTMETARPHAFDEARVRHVFRQLCDGVQAIHRAGKLHRDLKWANTLVLADGTLKILDFGLASDWGNSKDSLGQNPVGTAAYMAPEQLSGDTPLTPASDWYAVGVMLFELLTGRLPFDGSVFQVMNDKCVEAAPRASAFSEVPDDLDALCAGLLVADPEARAIAPSLAASDADPRSLGSSDAFSALTPANDTSHAFTGRGLQLATLNQDLSDMLAGQVVVRTITGPSGVGKTSLVERFLEVAGASTPELAVLAGRCHEQERVTFRALDSIVDALSSFWSQLPSARAHAILPRDLGCLLELFPVLNRVPCMTQASLGRMPLHPQERRRRAYAALRETLCRLSEWHPLVIFIDDFQWTDAESHMLLANLLSPPDPPRALVLLALREATLEDLGPKERTLRSLPTTPRAMEVPPFSEAEAITFCSDRLGPLPEALQLRFARECCGSPLLAAELVYFLQQGDVQTTAPDLQQAIRARLAAVSPVARQVALLCAIAPEPLPMTVLRDALHTERGDALRAVAEARAARFIKTAAPDEATLEPFHAQTRAALLSALEGAELPLQHRVLAEAHKGARAPQTRLMGYHFERAGAHAEAAEAFTMAAEMALGRNDPLAAAELFALAAKNSKNEKAALTIRQASALAQGGRDLAAADAAAGLVTGPANGPEALMIAAWYGRAGLTSRAEHFAAALLGRVGIQARRTQLGAWLGFFANYAAALVAVSRSFGRTPRRKRPGIDAHNFEALLGLSFGYSQKDTANAAYIVARFARYALHHGRADQLAEVLSLLATPVALAGLPGASRLLNHARAVATDERSRQLANVAQGFTHTFAGQWHRAIAMFDSAIESLAHVEHGGVVLRTGRFHRLTALFYGGELKQLRLDQAEALRTAMQNEEADEAARLRAGRCTTSYLIAGELERAEEALAHAAREASGKPLTSYYVWLGRATAALYGRNQRAAEGLLDEGSSYRWVTGFNRLGRAEHLAFTAGLMVLCGIPDPKAFGRTINDLCSSRLEFGRGIGAYYTSIEARRNGDMALANRALTDAAGMLDSSHARFFASAVKLRVGEMNEDSFTLDQSQEFARQQGIADWPALAYVAAPTLKR